jgi:5-methylcytosine-specific restriction endonuclease McrA
MTSLGRNRSSNTPRLLEMQAYRCAVCHRPIHTDHHYDAPDWPSMSKVNRALTRSYENCVLLCNRCCGKSVLYPTLMAYYEAYVTNSVPSNSREYPINESVLLEIREQLTAAGIPEDREFPLDYGKAPRSSIPAIVRGILKKIAHEDFGKPAFRRRQNAKSAKWMNDGNRRRFMEAQNHRCCYCGSRFDTEAKSTQSARYPSWEHVDNASDGGTSRMMNLVIACLACNNLRSIKDMSAYAFADWVLHNRDEVDKHAKNVDHCLGIKERRNGPGWEPTDRIRIKPFYAYS